jgi:hypothetical protein
MNIESTLLDYTNQLKNGLTNEEIRLSNLMKKLPKKGVRNVYDNLIELLSENKNRLQAFLLHINESIDNLGVCKEKMKNNETLQRKPIVYTPDMDLDKIILHYTNLLKNSFIPADSSVTNVNESLLTIIDSCINNLQISKEITERLLYGLDEKIQIINNQKMGTLEGLTRDTIMKNNIQPTSFLDKEILDQPYNESKYIKTKRIGGKNKKKITHKKRINRSRRKQTLKKRTFRKYKR